LTLPLPTFLRLLLLLTEGFSFLFGVYSRHPFFSFSCSEPRLLLRVKDSPLLAERVRLVPSAILNRFCCFLHTLRQMSTRTFFSPSRLDPSPSYQEEQLPDLPEVSRASSLSSLRVPPPIRHPRRVALLFSQHACTFACTSLSPSSIIPGHFRTGNTFSPFFFLPYGRVRFVSLLLLPVAETARLLVTVEPAH